MEQGYTEFAVSNGAAVEMASYVSEQQKRDCLRKRMFKRDGKKFYKYVDSTSTHGVRRMFLGKSKIRRVMWMLLFFAASIALSYTVVTSFITYFQFPTSTTVSTEHVQSLEFPTVTVCNFNPFRKSYIEASNLSELILGTFNLRLEEGMDIREYCDIAEASAAGINRTLKDVAYSARQQKEDFILDCNFRGLTCEQLDIIPTFNVFGYCYSFNSDQHPEAKHVLGGGFRHDLELVLNLEQQEYSGTFDREAGVYVVVHERGTPPIFFGHGVIIAPPGFSTFISLEVQRIDNRAYLDTCIQEPDDLVLLRKSKYSLSSCVFDCVLVQIAEVCGCVHGIVDPPTSGRFSDLPPCDVSKLCCIASTLTSAEECSCNLGCNHTLYDITTSLAAFPSRQSVEATSEQYNISVDDMKDNLVGVHVYFEELVLQQEVTIRSYSARDLISDIGGQLGLFIGASIISLTEFFVWVFDEIKDRVFGVKDKDINRVFINGKASLRSHTKSKESSNEVESDAEVEDE